MTPPATPTRCPSCGAATSGRFCHQCGAALEPRPCPSCGTQLSATARFCHRCGSPAAGAGAAVPRAPAPATGGNGPWIVALVVMVAAVGTIIWQVTGPGAPVPAGGGVGATAATPQATGTPPDISQMTPMDRFIRLNDRIMTAAAQGDSATVQTFLPMALAAYSQLPEADTDARYHAALLNVEGGDLAAATALADSILAGDPANLIGLTLLGTLAELAQDPAALAEARRRFLAAWPAEIGLPKQEYVEHREVLDAFRAGAGG